LYGPTGDEGSNSWKRGRSPSSDEGNLEVIYYRAAILKQRPVLLQALKKKQAV
jgi:hypothetical protein